MSDRNRVRVIARREDLEAARFFHGLAFALVASVPLWAAIILIAAAVL